MDQPVDPNIELMNFLQLCLNHEKEPASTNRERLFDLWITDLVQYVSPNYSKSSYLQENKILDDLVDSLDMDYESAFLKLVNGYLNFILEIETHWGIRRLTDFLFEMIGKPESFDQFHQQISELTEDQAAEIIEMYNRKNRISLI